MEKTMIQTLAKAIEAAGGRAYYVGGYVRDCIRGVVFKDVDIEVFGLEKAEFMKICLQFGDVFEHGTSYKVFHIKGYDIDFTLATKVFGDFQKHRIPTLQAAAKRRDFTMNALMQDVLTLEIYDFYHGINDLKEKIVKHVDEVGFQADPIRVYRAAQFCARFDFRLDAKTLRLCQSLAKQTKELANERIEEEWYKILMMCRQPSIAFVWLDEMGVLAQHFPFLHKQADEQGWKKKQWLLDEAASVKTQAQKPYSFMWAIVFQLNLQTVNTSEAEVILKEIRIKKIKVYVLQITTAYQQLLHLYQHPSQKAMYQFTAFFDRTSKVALQDVLLLAEVITQGMAPTLALERIHLNQQLQDLYGSFPPFIGGKELIALGYSPGSGFKTLLDQAYEYQMEGLSKEVIIEKLQSMKKDAHR